MGDARLTQAPLEVLFEDTPQARVTQAAVEALMLTVPPIRLTQAALEVLASGMLEARLTQLAVEVLMPYEAEEVVIVGESFGPLVWVEFSAPDTTTHVWAPVDLPDPSTYYHGFKSARIIGFGPTKRALSDENGDYESQRFEVELSDISREIRGWLGTEATRLLVNKLIVMRMISDLGRRALERPRTVAIGLIRSYRLH